MCNWPACNSPLFVCAAERHAVGAACGGNGRGWRPRRLRLHHGAAVRLPSDPGHVLLERGVDMPLERSLCLLRVATTCHCSAIWGCPAPIVIVGDIIVCGWMAEFC